MLRHLHDRLSGAIGVPSGFAEHKAIRWKLPEAELQPQLQLLPPVLSQQRNDAGGQ